MSDLSLSKKVLVTPPQQAALYDGVNKIPSRYRFLSLDLAEPNLGIPSTSNTFVLTSNNTGERGWTDQLDLTDFVSLTATFNHLTIREKLCSFGYTNVFDVSSKDPAVRITQRGSGYSLLVEDQQNPDNTPFIITSIGTVVIGTTAAEFVDSNQYFTIVDENNSEPRGSIAINRYGDGRTPNINFLKVGGTVATPVSTNPNQGLGSLNWSAWDSLNVSKLRSGGDFSKYITVGSINSLVDTYNVSVPLSTYPGRFEFRTFPGGNPEFYDTKVVMALDSMGRVGIGTSTPTDTLTVSGNTLVIGHLAARTKSFVINHPSKANKNLTYGSLESPYHGIRLTGKATLVKNTCEVELPDYISHLIHKKDINIQLTASGQPALIYVHKIDIKNNKFTVKGKGLKNYFKNIEFFWSFTGIRKDVDMLMVES
jgi:hypothetical protein